jgi:hypothetical protein
LADVNIAAYAAHPLASVCHCMTGYWKGKDIKTKEGYALGYSDFELFFN